MSVKTIIFGLIGFIVLVVALSFLMISGQKPVPNTTTYSIKENNRPKAETAVNFFDFGNIKVSDIKQKDFFLKNTGSKPLQILNINSSCGCTAGQIIYKDFTSKEYGMHSQSGYVTEIVPGDTATIRLIYRPATMPVYGFVEREVYVTTNDPLNQKLVFSIKANVK
ncbi:MAG: DUF1573 domain-containing protein [Patescibacteria group bacterium]|nr:DUF1573 domain-containing protein [Actinomycetota bacterium]MCL5438918.1 DUF1573 domain-containing protein [Patescibacteria group bacterium]